MRSNREQGKRNQAVGKKAEKIVANRLRSMGLKIVEPIGTPVRLTPYRSQYGKVIRGVFRVVFGDRVSGDIKAFVPGGRGVLCEVKYTGDIDRLQYSRLKDHQVEALWKCLEVGGLPLLAWVNDWGVFVMEWPLKDLRNGHRLSWMMSIAICGKVCND